MTGKHDGGRGPFLLLDKWRISFRDAKAGGLEANGTHTHTHRQTHCTQGARRRASAADTITLGRPPHEEQERKTIKMGWVKMGVLPECGRLVRRPSVARAQPTLVVVVFTIFFFLPFLRRYIISIVLFTFVRTPADTHALASCATTRKCNVGSDVY